MKVNKTTLPINSILNRNLHQYGYIDSFQGSFVDAENRVTSQQIGKAFFSSAPAWVDKLFTFRNKIVGIFGLKTSGKVRNREEQLRNFKCAPGEQLGLFRVFERTENEVVLGEDDKHLNFRVSLFQTQHSTDSGSKHLIISTTVEFKNWFGKLYFLTVRPMHKLIVPKMLKGIIRKIEEEKTEQPDDNKK